MNVASRKTRHAADCCVCIIMSPPRIRFHWSVKPKPNFYDLLIVVESRHEMKIKSQTKRCDPKISQLIVSPTRAVFVPSSCHQESISAKSYKNIFTPLKQHY